MLKSLKKYLALFSLLVFLLPLVAKYIHAHQHENDSHFSNKNGVSKSQEIHHCALCDYVAVTFATFNCTPVFVVAQHFYNCAEPKTTYFYTCFINKNISHHYSLRGPPSFIF